MYGTTGVHVPISRVCTHLVLSLANLIESPLACASDAAVGAGIGQDALIAAGVHLPLSRIDLNPRVTADSRPRRGASINDIRTEMGRLSQKQALSGLLEE